MKECSEIVWAQWRNLLGQRNLCTPEVAAIAVGVDRLRGVSGMSAQCVVLRDTIGTQ